MNFGYNSLWGVLILAGDIWAIINIFQSSASNEKKLIWTIAVVLLPVLGLILWYFLGPRDGRRRVKTCACNGASEQSARLQGGPGFSIAIGSPFPEVDPVLGTRATRILTSMPPFCGKIEPGSYPHWSGQFVISRSLSPCRRAAVGIVSPITVSQCNRT